MQKTWFLHAPLRGSAILADTHSTPTGVKEDGGLGEGTSRASGPCGSFPQHSAPRLSCPPERLAWAGVDEAGRGCLAGPVVAAVVVLPVDYDLPDLADSKKLKPGTRQVLAVRIKEQALAWGIGLGTVEEIDKLNILQATFLAMGRAVAALCGRRPGQHLPGLLIDGNQRLPAHICEDYLAHLPGLGQETLIKGDGRIPSIAAASILAKTHRDRLMEALARRYPGYGLESHKGYATKVHYAALAELGPCPAHRLTFAGVLRPSKPVAAQQYSLLGGCET